MLNNYKKKSQSMSIDILIGVIVFLAVFIVFYGILNPQQGSKAKNLKNDATTVIQQVSSIDAPYKIVEKEEINESRFVELKNLTYDEIKRNLRVDGDFCIFIEDNKGNIVLLNNTYIGIGSSIINVSDIPCNQSVIGP